MSKRFVYVLKDCGIPPRYYTGITSDVARRYAEHNAGSCIHTAKYRPWSIDLVLEFADEQRAVAFEALPQIRGRSRNDICDSLLIRDVTSADRVWNRAALESGGEAPKAGDRALAALLLMHGLVMNGGVQHALECVQPSELRAAVEGFAFFGFDDVATFLQRADDDPMLSEWTDENEVEANRCYTQMIPDDTHLVGRFQSVFRVRPDQFAPVDVV